MQLLSCQFPGHFEYISRPVPEPAPGRTLLKVRRVGVCGTDIHAFQGTQPFFTYPRVLGHELSGTIVATDAGSGFEAGQAVTSIPYFSCGSCIACRLGKPNCCVSIQVCGVHIDGAMAEYISVPTGSLVHGHGLSLDELALIEPYAIAMHGLGRAQVRPGSFVLVQGAGPIGLCAMQLAQIAGAQVIALDINTNRLDWCREHLDVPYIIDGAHEDTRQRLQAITRGDMPEVVIDATGSLQAINQGFHYLSHGGSYVLVGLQRGEFSCSHPEFHKREATLMSSRNATRADFEQVIQYRLNGQLKLDAFVTHRAAFADVADQFAAWTEPATGVIKALIEFPA